MTQPPGWKERPRLKDGEPCDHPGCLNHVSHPCEGCGRVAGRSWCDCHLNNGMVCPSYSEDGKRTGFCLICGHEAECHEHARFLDPIPTPGAQ